MDRLLLILSSLLLLTSCAEQYNIAGNSSVQCLDGRMLYLKVSTNNTDNEVAMTGPAMRNIDSCKVVHGRFNFEGDVDTVQMAMLYTGHDCVMPLIIENGNLSIQVDNAQQRVTGGPLNDKLYSFFKKRNRLDNEMWELQQKTIHMMRGGASPEEIERKLGKKAKQLTQKTEELETKFVRENYNNVLGPGFFMLLCSQYPTPIMTSQIHEIIKDAPQGFLNNPFVRHYLNQAQTRMAIQSSAPSPSTTTTIHISCP